MGIVDDVTAGMKEAMRARDKARLGALRNLRAAFLEGMKRDGADTLSDDAALAILGKQAKQRRESISAYTAGGREDLVAAEAAELAVIDQFLPAAADEQTVQGWVAAAIESTGASSIRDMGKVMGALKATHGAALDGQLASRLVKAALG